MGTKETALRPDCFNEIQVRAYDKFTAWKKTRSPIGHNTPSDKDAWEYWIAEAAIEQYAAVLANIVTVE